MDFAVRGSNPYEGVIFASVQTGPWVHPASYTMRTGLVSVTKWTVRGINHSTSFSAKVKERVEL